MSKFPNSDGVHRYGSTPASDSNSSLTERELSGAQREELISRKPVLSSDIHEQFVDLGSVQTSNGIVLEGNNWAPGFWRSFPFRGIMALFISLGCMAGSIAVLYTSDGQPVRDWKVYPTVYLALLMTGANMSLRLAFNQGVKISWWYQALRGSSVRKLHHQWSSGDGFWSAMSAGRYFNLVSLASIATTLVVIDQPLIQRASTVILASFSYPVNVTASIAPEIPWGYTGYQQGRGSNQMVMSSAMISAWNDYNQNAQMIANSTGCNDRCTGFVNAAGLAAQCSTVSGPIAYLLHTDNLVGDGLDPAANYLAETPFGVTFELISPNKTISTANASSIKMEVSYTHDSVGPSKQDPYHCTGIVTRRTCTLRPATIRYPVVFQGSNISLTEGFFDNSMVQSLQPSNPNATGVDIEFQYGPWTLGGLVVAANNMFASNATYQIDGTTGIKMFLPDTLSSQYLRITNHSFAANGVTYPAVCTSDWADPTVDILSGLNELSFRLSLGAAGVKYRDTSQPPAPQVLHMQETATINVFHSDYGFLIGSSLLSAIVVLLIAPTFWGWWEIGRSVTLNPIEVAKAFDAPFFQGPGSNATEQQIVRNTGARLLRYGESEGYGIEGVLKRQLRLAEPHEVSKPTPGVLYE